MIAIFSTIASAFVQIDAAVRAESPAGCLAKMYQRVLDNEKLTYILKRLDCILA
jgi:hypothetical protein